MLSYEEAYKIAKEQMGTITSYVEDTVAYIFNNDNEQWDGEIIVLKRNGKILSYSEYAMKYKREEEQKLGKLVPINLNTKIIIKESK